eukprot:m.168156 g.168156  ORF g.168156 m.168156 type:complete len:69 (+) comp38947_c0_seq5:1299-1505(+)
MSKCSCSWCSGNDVIIMYAVGRRLARSTAVATGESSGTTDGSGRGNQLGTIFKRRTGAARGEGSVIVV